MGSSESSSSRVGQGQGVGQGQAKGGIAGEVESGGPTEEGEAGASREDESKGSFGLNKMKGKDNPSPWGSSLKPPSCGDERTNVGKVLLTCYFCCLLGWWWECVRLGIRSFCAHPVCQALGRTMAEQGCWCHPGHNQAQQSLEIRSLLVTGLQRCEVSSRQPQHRTRVGLLDSPRTVGR